MDELNIAYKEDIDSVLKQLETKKDGLSLDESKNRLEKYGPNELKGEKVDGWFKVFLKQFTGFMSIVLLFAGVMSIIFGFIEKEQEGMVSFIEGGVIFAILILNGVIGTLQEVNANKTLESLKKIGAPTAKVYRNGKVEVIPAKDLVPGDIVYLEDGSIIPADLRLIESSNLQVQEASLTGESVPVKKDAAWKADKETLLAERLNMCYSSTVVTYGHGTGVVVGTALNTEIGKIASMLSNEKAPKTHIQKTMDKIGKTLTIVGAIAAVLVLILGFVANYVTNPEQSHGLKFVEPIMLAVSLAVAVIPEGLPTMTTILMAMGVKKMAEHNALVKDLPSVETLGSCTCICSDKTGTLTLNKMTVKKLLNVVDILNDKNKELIQQKAELPSYKHLLDCGVLCNTAELTKENNTIGDPTEGALLMIANDFSLPYTGTRTKYKKLHEVPFESDRKRMSVIYQIDNGEEIIYVKGATDEVLDVCTHFLNEKGKIEKLTAKEIKKIKDKNVELSSQALRMLSFAMKDAKGVKHDEKIENNLVYIGMMGLIDPPRKEVKAAVQNCHNAGIKVIMITGDHAITAKTIGQELDIYKKGDRVINGDELEKMTDADLKDRITNTTVFSRVSPAGKMRIIKALQSNHEITSMTGDGVNDAPSLKAADIGVAMGITGTDVAKSSANVILLDDNFTTIENAVFQGRRIFRNLQKVVQFLVSGCIAEVLIILMASIISVIPTTAGDGWGPALNPIQILMLNLVTDTIPCFALGLDPLDKDAKTKCPSNFREIFSKEVILNTVIAGVWFSSISILSYVLGETVFHPNTAEKTANLDPGMTMAFLTLSFSQVLHTFNVQSNTISMFSKDNQFNKWIPILSGCAALVVIAMMIVGFTGGDLASEIVGIDHGMGVLPYVLAFLFAFSIIPFIELVKFFERRKHHTNNNTNVVVNETPIEETTIVETTIEQAPIVEEAKESKTKAIKTKRVDPLEKELLKEVEKIATKKIKTKVIK